MSVKYLLTPEEFQVKLYDWVDSFPTATAAAKSISMSKQQLSEILKQRRTPTNALQDIVGYTHVDRYKKIRLHGRKSE